LGHRAGYVVNITTHASRRESIVKVGGTSRVRGSPTPRHANALCRGWL
jgi:hypothetical protein